MRVAGIKLCNPSVFRDEVLYSKALYKIDLTERRYEIRVLCAVCHIFAWMSLTVTHVTFFIVKCGIARFLCVMHVFEVWTSSSPLGYLCAKFRFFVASVAELAHVEKYRDSITHWLTQSSSLFDALRKPKLSLRNLRLLYFTFTVVSTVWVVYTVSQKKMYKFVFVRTVSNFHHLKNNFWQKDGKKTKIMQDALILHLIQFTSSHYQIKHRCSKLSHNAESCYLQLTF